MDAVGRVVSVNIGLETAMRLLGSFFLLWAVYCFDWAFYSMEDIIK